MFSTAFTYMASPPDLGPDLLLDLYPNARVAYSVRKLRKAYKGFCMRVRRSSDNTEKDISFLNNALNETELTDFVGAGDGFVTRFFDQSGNGNDARSITSANQPRIVNAGTIETINGKPAIRTIENTTRQNMDLTTAFQQAQWSQYMVIEKLTTNRQASGVCTKAGGGPNNGLLYFEDSNVYVVATNDNTTSDITYNSSALSNLTSPKIFMGISYTNGDEGDIWENSSSLSVSYATNVINPNFNSLFLYSDGQQYQSNAKHCEVVFWNGDQTANAVAIQNNANSYFSIY